MFRRLAVLSLLLAFVPASFGKSDPSSCTAIDNDVARLACYDQALGRTTTTTRSRATSVAVESPVSETQQSAVTETSQAEESFGLAPKVEKKITEITSRVSEIDTSAYGKLVFTLENEQVWRQLDAKSVPFKSGESVVIRSGMLGSHLLEKTSGSSRIRVKRIR